MLPDSIACSFSPEAINGYVHSGVPLAEVRYMSLAEAKAMYPDAPPPAPVAFSTEPLTDDLWYEATPLLVQHWREVAHYPDIPLDPDLETYRASAEAGLIRCFTARKASGQLIGYALFFVRRNPHYRGSLQAAQDVIYLDPSVRGTTGYRFIAWCDEQLQAEGVQVVTQHIKAAHNFGKMLERQGYELMDLIYTKRLT